jgi:glycosyltransferase involved in cell wall biosynthesis
VTFFSPPVNWPLPDAHRVAALRAYWSNHGGPVFGFASRFVEEKRPDLLLRALEIINQAYPQARVILAGEYPVPYEQDFWERHQNLIKQYRDQLIFPGLMNDMQEMADFYAACDVLALTSDSECFALVQVEAMLCGTPVVMTDIPGGRVPVTKAGMGKLAVQGDWRSIGAAIVDVLREPASYYKPREAIEAIFSFEETVNCYERVFREHARR